MNGTKYCEIGKFVNIWLRRRGNQCQQIYEQRIYKIIYFWNMIENLIKPQYSVSIENDEKVDK